MSDVTRLLDAIQHGDSRASVELLPLVYTERHQLARSKMAREQPDHTLQATALVHEALDAPAEHDNRKAELVKLRYFVGQTIEEAAEVLGISAPTATRD